MSGETILNVCRLRITHKQWKEVASQNFSSIYFFSKYGEWLSWSKPDNVFFKTIFLWMKKRNFWMREPELFFSAENVEWWLLNNFQDWRYFQWTVMFTFCNRCKSLAWFNYSKILYETVLSIPSLKLIYFLIIN